MVLNADPLVDPYALESVRTVFKDGVEYDPAWRAEAGVNHNQQKMGRVTNDDRADWSEAWVLFPGDVVYVWHSGLKASVVEASLAVNGFELRSQIIRAKDRLPLSRGLEASNWRGSAPRAR